MGSLVSFPYIRRTSLDGAATEASGVGALDTAAGHEASGRGHTAGTREGGNGTVAMGGTRERGGRGRGGNFS